MSELRIENWHTSAAEVGPENPLPPLAKPRYQPFLSGKSEDDPQAGYLNDYLPYPLQDGYTRQRKMTDLKVAVLENEILKATFLLPYGGRLWSLIHKPSGRELLYVNPMFQPANLAMRNAWFSGGVEWNMGVIAHTPFTCSPLFAARVEGPDGMPILRLYEWERIRQAAYQIDAYLPDGSEILYVHCRLVNPFDHALPIYWWSNIAVEEHEDVRVLAPAAEAYQYALSVDDLKTVAMPMVDGRDVSYTTTGKRAADYFFLIPDGQRPWVTALDAEGKGLIQVSTDVLRGRKLFLWGTGSGGRRWQEWLNGADHNYLEIQAGLAPTQLEYATLAPRQDLDWLEGYGLMQADAQAAHSTDWQAARTHIEGKLEAIAPRPQFEAELKRARSWQDQPPAEILQPGSGWGMLEALRRQAAGEAPFAGMGLDFGGALGSQQAPWVELLKTGKFPNTDSNTPAAGILVQEDWHRLLENAVKQDPDAGWEAWLHLGVMRLHAGDIAGAKQAWETSLARQRTAWALRNLAVLAQREGHIDTAVAYYREAQKLQPNLLPLLIESGRILIDTGHAAEFLNLLAKLPESMQENGRLRLLEVEAGLAAGEIERVGQLFNQGFEIVDYQEGDEILTHLWDQYHAERLSREEAIPVDEALLKRVQREYPLPAMFDFRMKVGKEAAMPLNFPIVDTHLHVWDPGYLRYPWLDGNPLLGKPYLLPQYNAATQGTQVEKMVFVQCEADFSQFMQEAGWVSRLAEQDPRLAGIVAWAPLENGDSARADLERLAAVPHVKGIRRIIQFEPDPDFCLRPDFVKGVQALTDFGLSFDICINHLQMENTLKLVRQCPNVSFMLDHIAKPDIKHHNFDPWRTNLKAFAEMENVWVKMSGLVVEADHAAWTRDDLKPYIDTVLEYFGFKRTVFGGDWPVILQAAQWQEWVDMLLWAVEGASEGELRQLFHDTAVAFYRLAE